MSIALWVAELDTQDKRPTCRTDHSPLLALDNSLDCTFPHRERNKSLLPWGFQII